MIAESRFEIALDPEFIIVPEIMLIIAKVSLKIAPYPEFIIIPPISPIDPPPLIPLLCIAYEALPTLVIFPVIILIDPSLYITELPDCPALSSLEIIVPEILLMVEPLSL